MKILVVGGGGREHAILWKLHQDNPSLKLYCAPGNGGTAQLAQTVDIQATDLQGLCSFAKEEGIDFTVIGMDDPLVMGIVDVFQAAGLKIFGPGKKAAQIEGSKSFAKDMMKRHGIPTAASVIFDQYEDAVQYIQKQKYPLVIKADGLALGKGVLICQNEKEAEDALQEMMIQGKFAEAGKRVVIEEFLTGQEVSVLAFCDGMTLKPMVSAQDHKRALDGDQGLNTGGMGAFSPSLHYTPQIEELCRKLIYEPTLEALKALGGFRGIVYFGLMLTSAGPKVIEYNCRFGDPETQAILPRLQTNLLDIFLACCDGTLDKLEIEWKKEAAACVIMASGGYPETYEKGFPVLGLDELAGMNHIMVFHAGTKQSEQGIVTSGGRVLGVTGLGVDLDQAVDRAYDGIRQIHFEKAHFRKDIYYATK